MNKLNKVVISMIMVFAMAATVVLPIIPNATVAKAATSKSSVTLNIGESTSLKISGTNAKATWKTSNKAVATVNSTGKVTAVAAGTAKITGTVKGKSYSCSVIVENPYITEAGFDAVEVKIGDGYVVVPKEWDFELEKQDANTYLGTITPASLRSNLKISIQKTGEAAPTYDETKESFDSVVTKNYIQKLFTSDASTSDAVVSKFKTFDFDTTNGTAYAYSYVVTLSGEEILQNVYALYVDNYYIEVTSSDIEKLDLNSIAEYAILSLRVPTK